MKRCAFSLFGRPTGFLLILLLAFPALYALSPTEGSPRILLPGRSIWPMDREWTFKIPYLGSRPTHWAIKHLPEGFTFDSHEGIIRGKASSRIVFEFEISAANESGADSCIWQVEVSRYNGLAPVMGWSTRQLTKGTAVLVVNAGESPTTTSIASRPDSSSAWDVSRAAYVPPSDLERIILSPHAARLFIFE